MLFLFYIIKLISILIFKKSFEKYNFIENTIWILSLK